LKDKRNRSEHDRNERNRDTYIEILVSNVLDVFDHELMVVVDKQPDHFSERTVRELRAYVTYLRKLKLVLFLQSRRTIAAAAAIVVIVVASAVLFRPSPPPREVRPTKGLVIIACNGLTQFKAKQLAHHVSKQCDSEAVIAVDVISESGVLWSKPVLSTNADSLEKFVEQIQSRSKIMTDITHFAASFDAAFLAMNTMYDHQITPRMVLLGHLPEITPERNKQLKTSGWEPSRIDRLISTWTDRRYASPLWLYIGPTHQGERAYVDSIMIKSDIVLTPEEHRL
jgi:hypothetical protein